MAKKLLYGKGVNDSDEFVRECGKIDQIYCHWANMMCRCFSIKYAKRRTLCDGCDVCEEWMIFSNFKRWCKSSESGYVDGYCLDKDILVSNNKIYSPETCCFVPKEINTIINKQKRQRGSLPIGVTKYNNRYLSQISKHKKRIFLGYFDTPEDAFLAYKREKEAYIKEVAQKYYDNGEITKRVYDALMKYEVEITD